MPAVTPQPHRLSPRPGTARGALLPPRPHPPGRAVRGARGRPVDGKCQESPGVGFRGGRRPGRPRAPRHCRRVSPGPCWPRRRPWSLVRLPGGNDFDIGRVAQNMMLAAAARGLGSCPITLHRREQAHEVLALPEDHEATWAIALGYPDEEAEPEQRRRAAAAGFTGRRHPRRPGAPRHVRAAAPPSAGLSSTSDALVGAEGQDAGHGLPGPVHAGRRPRCGPAPIPATSRGPARRSSSATRHRRRARTEAPVGEAAPAGNPGDRPVAPPGAGQARRAGGRRAGPGRGRRSDRGSPRSAPPRRAPPPPPAAMRQPGLHPRRGRSRRWASRPTACGRSLGIAAPAQPPGTRRPKGSWGPLRRDWGRPPSPARRRSTAWGTRAG